LARHGLGWPTRRGQPVPVLAGCARSGARLADALENIDIGGPRCAAAEEFLQRAAVSDPADSMRCSGWRPKGVNPDTAAVRPKRSSTARDLHTM
jgi:hypothetical protein